MLSPPGSKPERTRQEVRLKDRLNDDLRSGLNDPVADSRNRERPQLLTPGLRYEHPARGQRPPSPLPQIRGQLIEQPVNPVLLDIGDGLPVDAGRAMIGAHQLPRPLQNVPAVDLVIERVEPTSGISLGRPVKRSLQFSNLVLLDGPSHDVALTSRSLYVTHERSSGPSLTAGSVVPSAQAVIRPPPTPSRLPSTSRLITGYRTRTLRRSTAEPPGRGGPPKFPPPPYERSEPSTPGSPSGLHSRLFTPSMAFAVSNAARLSLSPPEGGKANDAAGFASRYGPFARSPKRAFDAGLRPDPFPDRAANLLPGLLAATRTGLTPAGDDEHERILDLHLRSPFFLAHLRMPIDRPSTRGYVLLPLAAPHHRREGLIHARPSATGGRQTKALSRRRSRQQPG